MAIPNPTERQVQTPRWVAFLGVGLALVVLGGTLAWAALDLRARVRSQIVQRDGEILDAVTQMQRLDDQTNGDAIASLDDVGEQLQLALEVSRLRNVLGVRLYSATGKSVNSFPAYIADAPLARADFDVLQQLKPLSFYSAKAQIGDQDLLAETNSATVPLLFVEVPLRSDDSHRLAGIIQFVMDGSGIARQYADVDRDLAIRFSAAFVVAASILIAGLSLALRRLQHSNQRLAERTSSLLQANRELALAARTSAVGAVAAHLIHGLRNPLSGLRNFVHAHNSDNRGNSDTEWQYAAVTAHRMEELINRVVRVLQEQQSGVEYEVSVGELANMLAQRAKTIADSSRVQFVTDVKFERALSNRESDLILLILENLVQNGIEATPPGKRVELIVSGDGDATSFEVIDQGPGLSPATHSRLFMPCTSTKKGGGGIGLAISRQLAQSLGATLEIAANGPEGCTFRLSVPHQQAELKTTPNAEHPLDPIQVR